MKGVISLKVFKLITECATRSSYGEPREMHEMTIPFHGCFVPKESERNNHYYE